MSYGGDVLLFYSHTERASAERLAMKLRLGDEIVWGDLEYRPFRKGTITQVEERAGGSFYWVDCQHKQEDFIYERYCWPARAKGALEEVQKEHARIREAYQELRVRAHELRQKYEEQT